MSIEELKIELKQSIDALSDAQLNQVYSSMMNLLDPIDADTGLRRSKLLELLEEGERDVREGRVISHEEFKKKVKERFNL